MPVLANHPKTIFHLEVRQWLCNLRNDIAGKIRPVAWSHGEWRIRNLCVVCVCAREGTEQRNFYLFFIKTERELQSSGFYSPLSCVSERDHRLTQGGQSCPCVLSRTVVNKQTSLTFPAGIVAEADSRFSPTWDPQKVRTLLSWRRQSIIFFNFFCQIWP